MSARPAKAPREPMDSTDVAWLRMDSGTNLMVVNSVMLLATPVTLQKLRQAVAARFLAFPRFRKRVVKHLAGASWEDDPAFDISRQVSAVPAGTVRGKKGLQRLVARLAMAPLDPSRPLWHIYLVPRYQGGSAVILRIHHCYADGIAMIRVLLAMTDASPGEEPPAVPPDSLNEHDDGAGRTSLLKAVGKAADDTLHAAADLWAGGLHAVSHPQETLGLAAAATETVKELITSILSPADPPTRLHRPLTGVKQVAWAEPMPLAGVRQVARALGCTINDLLVSCAAGALRAYLIAQGDSVERLEFRAEVPVNMRPEDEDFSALGNRFGLLLLDLPIGIENPFERLFEVHRRMNVLKHSRQPIASYLMLNAMGRLPEMVEKQMLNFFTTKATTVLTNVPGPGAPVYFAGSELAQLLFWVPQAGQVGIGISIFSYRGDVQIGLITDEILVPDPAAVVKRFGSEFRALADRVRIPDKNDPGRRAA
jgi:WS/DGAT/MGAT family acyltransferase